MGAFYNEIDPQKAAWLRELIKANVIAPGEVDERSITDVEATDLRGFTQCHFFAGIGVWSYSLRLAGWPDDRPVWTGSCPCPSFSAAGKGKGFADPRHLWPHWIRLVRERRPPVIFGEQVAAAIGHGWLDLVYVDLEAAAYSVGAVVLGACSVGAPHIRQRLYFCAHAEHAERRPEFEIDRNAHGRDGFGWSSDTERSSDMQSVGRRMGKAKNERTSDRKNAALADDSEPVISSDSNVRLPSHGDLQRSGEQRLLAEDSGTGDRSDSPQRGLPMHGSAPGNAGHAAQPSESGIGADAPVLFAEQFARQGARPGEAERGRPCGEPARHGDALRIWRGPGWLDPLTARSVAEAGATRGFWADCDWWHARDEKYRPIESGLFPLAHGATRRVLKLRGYGDAIAAPVAAEFIKAFLEAEGLESNSKEKGATR